MRTTDKFGSVGPVEVPSEEVQGIEARIDKALKDGDEKYALSFERRGPDTVAIEVLGVRPCSSDTHLPLSEATKAKVAEVLGV